MTWIPPEGPLGELVAQAYVRAGALRAERNDLEDRALSVPRPRPFVPALRGADVRVIAEIKRRSPSRGDIAPGLDPASQAAAYGEGGAAAISVLTEGTRFGGMLEDLRAAGTAGCPILRKDFIVDPLQVLESRVWGASAVLLIVRALPSTLLAELLAVADACGLEALVEVRDESELETALSAGARVVGVNSRDLETLVIDPGTAERLLPAIPPPCVRVWESGVAGVDDVRRAARAGADAVLVGSHLSAAADPRAAVRALTGIPVAGRA